MKRTGAKLLALLLVLAMAFSLLPLTAFAAQVPYITEQPFDQAVGVGTDATFSVTAASPDGGTLHYQWQYRMDGVWTTLPNGTVGNYTVSGASTNIVTVKSGIVGETALRCIVVNQKMSQTASVYSSEVKLTVLPDINVVAVTGLDAPVVDYKPDTSADIPADASYSVASVTWDPLDNPFRLGTAYTVRVVLESKTGANFSSKVNATINGMPATMISGGGSEQLALCYTFPTLSNVISLIEFTGLDAPVAGATPDTTVSVITPNVLAEYCNVLWYPADEVFRPYTMYTAYIYGFDFAPGCTLDEELCAKVNGKYTFITAEMEGDYTVSFSFPDTGEPDYVPVCYVPSDSTVYQNDELLLMAKPDLPSEKIEEVVSAQWYVSASNVIGSGSPISGANDLTYHVDTSIVGTRWYYCVMNLRLNSGSVISSMYSDAPLEKVTVLEGELPFQDVDRSQWYYNDVVYAYVHELMNGTTPTTFSPTVSTNRAMIVTILYRLEGRPTAPAENPFSDVEDGLWYTDAIRWAAYYGIVDGYGNGKFGPNDKITREQMATILYRYASYKCYDTSQRADLSHYTDGADVSAWAEEAMQWANAEGLINGTSSQTLTPRGYAQRCQIAAILQRFRENLELAK